MKPGAPRTVLVLLLAIAALELGISSKFSTIWQLAFSGHIQGTEDKAPPRSTEDTAPTRVKS